MRESQLSAVRTGHLGYKTILTVLDLALPPNAQPDRENI